MGNFRKKNVISASALQQSNRNQSRCKVYHWKGIESGYQNPSKIEKFSEYIPSIQSHILIWPNYMHHPVTLEIDQSKSQLIYDIIYY